MTTAMSLRTFSHGTVMWMPLAGRIESASWPSSSVRSSSAHTPAAFTTTLAATSMRRPSASTVAPVTSPLASLTKATTRQRLASTAPRAAAVRAIVSTSRASSVVASKYRYATRQPLAGHRRQVGEGGIGLEALVQAADAEAAGEVVHPHRRAECPGDAARDQPVLGQDRDHERQQADEVRGVAAQPLPLAQRLVDEPHVALLEVPQPAVDELRAAARGPAGEVVGLDQRGREAAARGVESDADTGDAAADDEHVEALAWPGVPASLGGRTVAHSGDFPPRSRV